MATSPALEASITVARDLMDVRGVKWPARSASPLDDTQTREPRSRLMNRVASRQIKRRATDRAAECQPSTRARFIKIIKTETMASGARVPPRRSLKNRFRVRVFPPLESLALILPQSTECRVALWKSRGDSSSSASAITQIHLDASRTHRAAKRLPFVSRLWSHYALMDSRRIIDAN